MVLIRELDLNDCQKGTSVVNGLSRQIISEMNLLISNVMVSFDDLNVEDVGSAVFRFLQPAAKESLRLAIKERDQKLKIRSAYRTIAQQYILYRQFLRGLCNIGRAAKPSFSNHEDGLAFDTPDFDVWKTVLEKYDWEWYGSGDRVHFTYVGSGVRDDIGNIGVKAFQILWNKNNANDRISEDGIYGDQTEARLRQSPNDGFSGVRLLKLVSPNMQGEDVRKVQQALINSKFLDDKPVTGIYDSDTESAVRKFQEKKGLDADGIVGAQTLKAMGIKRQTIAFVDTSYSKLLLNFLV